MKCVSYRNLERAGRLGNQLWEIASTVGIARTHKLQPAFPADWSYRPYFNVPDEFFVEEFEDDVDATHFVPHMDVRCKSYLQDFNLFRSVGDEVKEWFKPSVHAVEVLDKHLGDSGQVWIKDIAPEATSLHVRRGDNVTHPPGFHPLTTIRYYQEAAKLFRDNKIVVFSDDILWCEETLPDALERDDLLFVKNGPTRGRDYVPEEYLADPALDWIDLQLMASCTQHIIANSSYSWWGAFLSDNGRVAYPSVWYGNKLRYINWKLMIPETWEMVKC